MCIETGAMYKFVCDLSRLAPTFVNSGSSSIVRQSATLFLVWYYIVNSPVTKLSICNIPARIQVLLVNCENLNISENFLFLIFRYDYIAFIAWYK